MGNPGQGSTLDPAEFNNLKARLQDASDALGLRDFTAKASLEGSMTVQSVSPHEDVEQTVDEELMALTHFVDRDYAATTRAVQDFINRTHTTIETAIDAVHQTLMGHVKAEEASTEAMRRFYPQHPGS
jgi:hypothetical protein